MLIVQVCDFGDDGDARHRMHEPSRHLGRLPGVTAIDCHFRHRTLPQLVELADVLVLQFVNDWDWLAVCTRRRVQGKLTIFEANDYFFDLQPWNPIADGWRDPLVQELYLQVLVAAGGVQTSTVRLAPAPARAATRRADRGLRQPPPRDPAAPGRAGAAIHRRLGRVAGPRRRLARHRANARPLAGPASRRAPRRNVRRPGPTVRAAARHAAGSLRAVRVAGRLLRVPRYDRRRPGALAADRIQPLPQRRQVSRVRLARRRRHLCGSRALPRFGRLRRDRSRLPDAGRSRRRPGSAAWRSRTAASASGSRPTITSCASADWPIASANASPGIDR